MADFPMEYDPCSCQFDSKLKIDVNLVGQADVKETSTTTGTLLTTNTSNPGATQTSSDFNQAFSMGKKAYNNFSAGQKTYKSLDSWASGVKSHLGIVGNATSKKAAIDALKDAMKNSGFLKTGLNSLPYVGLAVSAFDAFFGGGKEESGPQPVALQPMTIEMNTITTGTITANALYSNPTFDTPGNRTITTALEYPYYNEVMGVFSLIRKPVVEVRASSSRNGTDVNRLFEYHIAEPLQYVINPASGLEVQDFQVALIQEGNKYPTDLDANWEYEGMVPGANGTATYAVRSAYTDSGCLTNQTFALQAINTTREFNPTGGAIYLKFILNLRPRVTTPTTQNVLVVLKYPVTVRSVTKIVVDNTQPCLAVQPQMTATDVQAICNGSVYQAAMTLRTAATAGHTSTTSAQVQIYPNPATDAATIRFSITSPSLLSAYLTDMFGNRVLTIAQNEAIGTGLQQRTFSTISLKSGLYQCVLETPDGKRVVSTRLSVVH